METNLQAWDSSVAGGSEDKASQWLIAFPVLALAPPLHVLDCLVALPARKGIRVNLLAVCGSMIVKGRVVEGWPGQALEQAEHILRKGGYSVVSSAFLSYPVNWTQMSDRALLLVELHEGFRKVLRAGI